MRTQFIGYINNNLDLVLFLRFCKSL